MAVAMIATGIQQASCCGAALGGCRVSVCIRHSGVVRVHAVVRGPTTLAVRRHRRPTELDWQQNKQQDDHEATHGWAVYRLPQSGRRPISPDGKGCAGSFQSLRCCCRCSSRWRRSFYAAAQGPALSGEHTSRTVLSAKWSRGNAPRAHCACSRTTNDSPTLQGTACKTP